MKCIALHELEKNIHAQSYEQLCKYIYKQIETEKLKPVKASKTNGKKPGAGRNFCSKSRGRKS